MVVVGEVEGGARWDGVVGRQDEERASGGWWGLGRVRDCDGESEWERLRKVAKGARGRKGDTGSQEAVAWQRSARHVRQQLRGQTRVVSGDKLTMTDEAES